MDHVQLEHKLSVTMSGNRFVGDGTSNCIVWYMLKQRRNPKATVQFEQHDFRVSVSCPCVCQLTDKRVTQCSSTRIPRIIVHPLRTCSLVVLERSDLRSNLPYPISTDLISCFRGVTDRRNVCKHCNPIQTRSWSRSPLPCVNTRRGDPVYTLLHELPATGR